MVKENLTYLLENLKYLGFGENSPLTDDLKAEVAKKNKEFQLVYETFYSGDHKLEAVLYFKKGDQSDIYFFNKYYALLRCGDDPEQDKGQTFYISKGIGITCKEAFNLLQGRAVYKNLINKDGVKYNAWVQLDFSEKTMHNNYRTNQIFGYQFNIEQALQEHPIVELKKEDQKTHLIRSLQRGNLQMVALDYGIKTEKGLITADPFNSKINIYKITNGTDKTTRRKGTNVMPEAEISPDPDDGFDLEWEDEKQPEDEGVLEAGQTQETREVLDPSQVNEPENSVSVKKPAKKRTRKIE
ncbi:hypothetical protein ACX0G9_05490 [Flavitalea flava]